jgi:tetratricopeptide (TPR) repeat protein
MAALTANADLLNYDKVITNRQANKKFQEKDYQAAKDKYQQNSLKYPENGSIHYNLANALYKQGKLEDAAAEYKMALRDNEFDDHSKLFQNMGNIKFQQQDYKNALEYFKKSLVADPANPDARYNYEMAARFLQKQQQQQQQQNQNQNNDNKDDKEQQQKQQQQNNDQDNKEDQKQQQQQQNNDQDNKEDQKQQQQQLKKSKDQQEAEQMLKALLAKEKEEMKKEKEKQAAQRPKSGKYW